MTSKHRPHRLDRVNHYGIDTVSSITWTKWEVGGRYNKSLTFRNVSSSARTIQYNIPDLNVFYMEYPESVKLNPGMSYTTQISFRPIQYKSYEDVIQVHTDIGDFTIGIHAKTASLNISIPESIDFSFCPIGIRSSRQFSVTNSSICAAAISWSIERPFRIQPTSAHLAPKQSQIFQCELLPDIAAVYKAEAHCMISGPPGVDPDTRSLSIRAVSKYAHIELDSDQVEFGLIPLDRHEQRQIRIKNLSLVPAHIQCQNQSQDDQDPFWLQLPSDHIPIGPESSVTATVHYKARQPARSSVHQFQIDCAGGNTVSLVCRGTGIGPRLLVEPEYIDFKDIELGNSSHQSILLLNESEHVPLKYEIVGGYGVFQLGSRSGEIQPGCSVNIRIRFRPNQAINYYERLEILVDQSAPLFVHVIATCFSRDTRPPQFTIEQLKQYHQRCAVNLGLLSPQSLQHQIDRHRAEIDSAPIITNLSPESVRYDSYFRVAEVRAVEIVDTGAGIQFGSCPILGGAQIQQVHVQNNTETKILVIWHDDVVRNSPFTIHPKQQDIRPQSSAEFQLKFQPQHDHQYYSRYISATAYFKVNRSFRLVTDSTFCSPWNLIVPVFGNTFHHGAEHFFPVGGFHPAHIELPAVRPGEISYGTVRLNNHGNTPIHFVFSRTSTDSDVLQLKPGSGCIRPNSFAIIALRFAPKEAGSVHFDFECVSNYTHKWLLHVTAEAEQAQIKFQPNSTIYFPPSCPGSVISRSQTLTNSSRIPATFRLNIDQNFGDIVKVTPDHGSILGNDSVHIVWSLHRIDQERINAKVTCDLFQDLDDSTPYKSIPLMIKSDAARLNANLELIESDERAISIVGVSYTHRLRLNNSSDCDLIYKLDCKMLTNLSFDYELRLDHSSAPLPGHGSIIVDSIVTLWGRSAYQFAVSCSVPGHDQLCQITVAGESVLPSLQIVDIFSDDVPVSSIDKLFRPDLINDCLNSDLSKFESDLQKFGPSPELCWSSEYMSQHLPTYICRFMPRLLGHSSTCTVIRLQNTGPVPVQLQIRGPAALDLDHELWVEPEQRSMKQQQYIQIVKNEFVRFEPERAHIAVNEFVDVVLTCSHSHAQSIQLPLIFDIALGKKFICNLIADTVLHNLRAVVLLDRCHELIPMPIGLQEPNVAIQQLRLHNNGAVPVEFQINDEAFLRANEDALGYPVLQCLTKQGCIQPNDVINIRIKFRPLQSITYKSKLEIAVANGAAEQVEIIGRGFVPGGEVPSRLSRSVLNASIRPQNRLALLYPYVIQAGQMCPQSTTEHIVFIENISNDNICFEFCNESRSSSDSGAAVHIEPRKAILDAGQRQILHVTVSAGSLVQRLSKLIRVCVCRVSQSAIPESYPNLANLSHSNEGLSYHNTVRSRMASKVLFKSMDSSREWSINNQLEKPIMSASLWLEIEGDVVPAPMESLHPFIPLVTDSVSRRTDVDSEQDKVVLHSFLSDLISKKQYHPLPGARQSIPFFVHLPNGPLPNPKEFAQNLQEYVGEKLLQHNVRTVVPGVPKRNTVNTVLHDSAFYKASQQLLNEAILDLIHDIDNGDFKPPKQVVVKGLVFK